MSLRDEPLSTPAQSVHVELSPPQTPHASYFNSPPGVPAQSGHVEMSNRKGSAQNPHSLMVALPFGMPSQSKQLVPLPPHTPHASGEGSMKPSFGPTTQGASVDGSG